MSTDEPRWLDERERAAWQGFLEASSRVARFLEHQLKDEAGLSHPQYEILVWLDRSPDGLRMSELADCLITSKSGLTYQVSRLEKRGLVRRRSVSTDVRGVLAELTEEGRRALVAAAPGHVAAVRESLIDVLGREELDVLAEALGRVGARLAGERRAGELGGAQAGPRWHTGGFGSGQPEGESAESTPREDPEHTCH